MRDGPFSAFEALTFVFSVSSLAGFTRLLNSDKPVTLRSAVASTLSTGLYSLGASMMLWNHFADQQLAIVGLAILTGIGTQTSVEFVWSMVTKVVAAMEAKKGL